MAQPPPVNPLAKTKHPDPISHLDATKKFEKLMIDKREIEGLPATVLGLAAQTIVSKGQSIWTITTEVLKSLVLLELARNRNKIPLPKSIAGPAVPLPPEQDTLINPNYQLAILKKHTSQPVEEIEDEEGVDPSPNPSQEQKTDMPQNTPQRVSFPLVAEHSR
ncbi:unnamed protein product [Ilex paraguariensis]|uniref:Uncharacterized protein n=1 Tax=Ilex paraguariensis TaxID=185542 RepID=A0ABC8RS75_9AQUA